VTFGDANVAVADAAGIPGVGAYVGSLSAVWTLGLANEGCNSQVPVTFDFVDANIGVLARPFTNGGAMTVGVGGLPAAVDDALTDFTYIHTLDPLGLNQGADVAGLGTAPEGTIAAGVNEIRIDSEEMLVVGVDTAANQYRVVRGWNGTTPAAHAPGAAVSRVPVIYPNGPSTNLLANLAQEDGDLDNNGVAEEAPGAPGGSQFNGNQVADGADAVPSFVRNSLDPNGDADDGGYIQPHARYFATAFVASTLITVYQIVITGPGALATLPEMEWMTTTWGYPALAFLQDPLGPPSNSALSDFCNFTSSQTLRGITQDNACTGAAPPSECSQIAAGFLLKNASDGGCPGTSTPNECGSVRLTNPATNQTIKWQQYSVSQRDWDSDQYLPELGDGHENRLDVCFAQGNPGWNPREFNGLSSQDGDADGLPTACDPNDSQPDADQDGDGWQNRIDNCPLVANAAPGGGSGTDPNTYQLDRDVGLATPAPDSGPRSDDIGPACDPNPTDINGHYHSTMLVRNICIGAATSACSTSTDSDADRVVNAADNCINVPNGPDLWGPPSGFAQSQRDLDADGQLNVIGELAALVVHMGSVGGLPGASAGYDGRFDVDYDNAIDIADWSIMIEYVFGTC